MAKMAEVEASVRMIVNRMVNGPPGRDRRSVLPDRIGGTDGRVTLTPRLHVPQGSAAWPGMSTLAPGLATDSKACLVYVSTVVGEPVPGRAATPTARV